VIANFNLIRVSYRLQQHFFFS